MRKVKLGFITLALVILIWNAGKVSYAENPWRIRINIPEYRLFLYRTNELFQTFEIAIGKQDTPSPIGDFQIINKITDPVWYPPDKKPPVPPGPNNPLGKYWLGLSKEGYGIHGNIASWSIGNPASLGCFRMHNADIAKLYRTVPVGTPVQVTYQTVLGGVDQFDRAWLELYQDVYNLVNLEEAVHNVLPNINWSYEPNLIALHELLNEKKPARIEVPRAIKILEAPEEVDGFYWNREVYLSKNSVPRPPAEDGTRFPGYLKLKTLASFLEGRRKYTWNDPENTLKIDRLKTFLNGVEITDAGWRRGEQRIFVDLKKITIRLGGELFWSETPTTCFSRNLEIRGELHDEVFWVELGTITKIWPYLHYEWDEDTWTLKLTSR